MSKTGKCHRRQFRFCVRNQFDDAIFFISPSTTKWSSKVIKLLLATQFPGPVKFHCPGLMARLYCKAKRRKKNYDKKHANLLDLQNHKFILSAHFFPLPLVCELLIGKEKFVWARLVDFNKTFHSNFLKKRHERKNISAGIKWWQKSWRALDENSAWRLRLGSKPYTYGLDSNWIEVQQYFGQLFSAQSQNWFLLLI